VIEWREQEPDFRYHPVDRVSRRLAFSTVCSLALRPSRERAIIVDGEVWSAISTHLSSTHIEQGGLLIGRAFAASPLADILITIERSVPSQLFDGTSVSLVMGSQVWEDARVTLPEGRSVIGWYHSHPDLGAFFSGTDRLTQKQFFDNPHSVGLVHDPVRREEKWFIGGTSMPVSESDVYVASLA